MLLLTLALLTNPVPKMRSDLDEPGGVARTLVRTATPRRVAVEEQLENTLSLLLTLRAKKTQ